MLHEFCSKDVIAIKTKWDSGLVVFASVYMAHNEECPPVVRSQILSPLLRDRTVFKQINRFCLSLETWVFVSISVDVFQIGRDVSFETGKDRERYRQIKISLL
jgi:hypothetical protein